MKEREITIYDNYYSLDREKTTREYLFEECAYENGWNSPEDIPNERVKDEIYYQDCELWEYLADDLEALFGKNVYLLTGTCGRWNGPSQGGKFIRSLNDFTDCIEHLDSVRIFDKNGHLYIHGSHHDGSDDYELKRLTHKGYELAASNHFALDRHLHTTIMRYNFYSALPKFAQKVYGI